MSGGFNTTVWQKKPTKRKAKGLWLAINRVSGSPPSMMEYLPPNRWTILEDGDRVWRNTAEWVIHHELGMFRFKGSAKAVSEQIETKGLY